jgi:hypothetical protein
LEKDDFSGTQTQTQTGRQREQKTKTKTESIPMNQKKHVQGSKKKLSNCARLSILHLSEVRKKREQMNEPETFVSRARKKREKREKEENRNRNRM